MKLSDERTETIPTISDLRSDYRAQGWWVDDSDPAGQVSLVVGGQVNALALPADLGQRVQRILAIHMLAGPVLSYPAQRRWVFLTEPDPQSVPPDVAAEGVSEIRPGKRLRLPATRQGSGEVGWIDQPETGHPAPPRQAVLSAVRRACCEADLERSA